MTDRAPEGTKPSAEPTMHDQSEAGDWLNRHQDERGHRLMMALAHFRAQARAEGFQHGYEAGEAVQHNACLVEETRKARAEGAAEERNKREDWKAKYELLASAVNENDGGCADTCNSYGHAEDCKTGMATSLALQQQKIASLRDEGRELREAAEAADACIREHVEKMNGRGNFSGHCDGEGCLDRLRRALSRPSDPAKENA